MTVDELKKHLEYIDGNRQVIIHIPINNGYYIEENLCFTSIKDGNLILSVYK